MVPKHRDSGTIYTILGPAPQFKRYTGIPVNGEEWYDEPGYSCGFVHLADALTGEKVAFVGVNHFDEYAQEVAPLLQVAYTEDLMIGYIKDKLYKEWRKKVDAGLAAG